MALVRAASAAALALIATAQPVPPVLRWTADGTYNVTVSAWNTVLVVGPTAVLVNGTWLTSADGSLQTTGNPTIVSGRDAWGDHFVTTLSWAKPGGPALLQTKFKVRSTRNARSTARRAGCGAWHADT